MDLGNLLSSTNQTFLGEPQKYSYKEGTYTIFNRETGQIETVDINKVKGDLRSNINEIIRKGTAWPNASINKGFLSPHFINPSKDVRYSTIDGIDVINQLKVGEYEYIDWMGQLITSNPNSTQLDTSERFNESKDLPKTTSDLKSSPYSTRDNYLLFNDTRTDYFKHGLQIIDGLNPIENPENGDSDLRLSQFQQTPFENNDPVMFGFEIIIDDNSSPLLNGSVLDFLKIYSGIDEIKYKIPVYEDFKQQFIKLFRTKTGVNINQDQVSISKSKSSIANSDSPKDIFNGGRKAYMSYYLKKIGGLGNLVESNTTDKKKFLVDYRTDFISLEFTEDVSLTMGTLAHLYKLLYWSKPNGKNLVPENLLRFNCDIIISECRNFNRVRKAIDNGDIEVIKDNLSRYVYSLKECQLFFNSMPHNSEIDMANIATYDNYSIQFDYKYSTVKFERFMPSGNFGKYVGYDSGAIWKVGNPGARLNRGGTQSTTSDTSVPRFFTSDNNYLNENGVKLPLVLQRLGVNLPEDPEGFTTDERVSNLDSKDERFSLDKFKSYMKDQISSSGDLRKLAEEQARKIELLNNPKAFVKKNVSLGNFIDKLKNETIRSAKRELATLVNGRVSLLSRTINKLLIDFVGRKGVSPPQNVYTGPQDPMGIALTNTANRFFYDIRNELADFAGGALSNLLNGATSFTKK